MDELNVSNLTASEIDNLKVDMEKRLKVAQLNLHKVEIDELEIAKQIIILQGNRKDLQVIASKAKQIVRELSLNIRILTSEFWRAKDNR